MTEYAYTMGGEPIAFRPEDGHFRADVEGVETWHPLAALTIWDDEERAAFGIVRTEVPPPVLTAGQVCDLIDNLRDARIDGGFEYMGHRFQSRASDRENIAALGADASEAIRDGKAEGDYLWHPEFPQGFGFINEANVAVPMDAFQMKGLRGRGTGYKAAQTFHARDLKDAVLAAEAAGQDPSTIEWRTGWPS